MRGICEGEAVVGEPFALLPHRTISCRKRFSLLVKLLEEHKMDRAS